MFQHVAKVTWLNQTWTIGRDKYQNGRTALMLIDAEGERGPVVSVNLPDAPLADYEIGIRDYSETEGILQALILAEVVHPPHEHIPSGFVRIPICYIVADKPPGWGNLA